VQQRGKRSREPMVEDGEEDDEEEEQEEEEDGEPELEFKRPSRPKRPRVHLDSKFRGRFQEVQANCFLIPRERFCLSMAVKHRQHPNLIYKLALEFSPQALYVDIREPEARQRKPFGTLVPEGFPLLPPNGDVALRIVPAKRKAGLVHLIVEIQGSPAPQANA
jgi:hypothetical protein